MQFHTIDHSFLSHIAYEDASETMTLVFRRGEGKPSRAYNYLGILAGLYEEVLDSLNPGTFFQRNVRPHFTYEEVGAEKLETTLKLAVGLGYERFATSSRTSRRRELTEVMADAPDETFHGDEDCAGQHLWILGGPVELDRGGDQRPVWHLNLSNGLVVPPTPRLVERS